MFLPSVVYTTRFVVLLTVLLYAPITFAQNSYLIGNVQLSNLLDNETMPSEIGFQFHSRASIGA